MHTLASGSGAPRRRSLLSRLALVSLLSFYIANWLRWLTWSERLESQTTKYFGPLGWTAFGGPSANIVLIRKVSLALPSASPQSRIADTRRRLHQIFVTKQEWVDDQTFNDLLALGNALPGPAFSQVSSFCSSLDERYTASQWSLWRRCEIFEAFIQLLTDQVFVSKQLAFAISCLHDGTLCGLWSFVLLTAPCAIIMTGVAFAVRRIPETLPNIVFALFTGLNAATVGLVALAAYQLSKKVVTDQTTLLLLFFSGAIASCYESQWLYPVLMVAGGATTLIVDQAALYRTRRNLKRSTNSSPVTEEPIVPVEQIEMQLPRPAAPVATKSHSSGMDIVEPSGTTMRRGYTNGSDSIERYPTPPLEEPHHRRGITEETREPVVEPEEEVYFKLTIKQGLYM